MLRHFALRRPHPLLCTYRSNLPLGAGLKFSSLSTLRPQSLAPGRVNNEQTGENDHQYRGPLAVTFRRLKIFSLSSLGLSFAMTPFIFIIESTLPLSARFALATIAVSTSGLSTLLVSWCGHPYVVTLRHLKATENHGGVEGLEMTTFSFWLRERVTRVYDTQFLVDTKRPLAKWELAQMIRVPAKSVVPGQEETIAETMDGSGKPLGRYIVKWGDDGVGTCRSVGKVVR
jgi:hypothetical protein